MTYLELKQKLDVLTPEQLANEIVWTGDERGGKVKSLWIADEDWAESDGGCEPVSLILQSNDDLTEDDLFVVIPKGTPQLLVD